jgi:hypothetical protein
MSKNVADVKVKFSQLKVGDWVEHLNRENLVVKRKILWINKDKTVALVKSLWGAKYRIRNKDLIRVLKD